MTAFSWLGDMMGGLMKLLPRIRLVKAGHGAIRYSPRGKVEVLGPDLYLYWPVCQEFEDFPTASQTVDVAKLPLVTRDGVRVSAGGALTFEVVNLEKFCIHNWNSFDDVDDIAQIALRDVIRTHDFVEIQDDDSDQIDWKLRREAGRRLRRFGVRVNRLSLKGFAPCRLVHVVGDAGHTFVAPPKEEAE